MFNSQVNRAEQGGALPIIYGGPLMVGSTVVASGVTIIQTGEAEDVSEVGQLAYEHLAVVQIFYYERIFTAAVAASEDNWPGTEASYGPYNLVSSTYRSYNLGNTFTWTETIPANWAGTQFDYYDWNGIGQTVNSTTFTISGIKLQSKTNILSIYKTIMPVGYDNATGGSGGGGDGDGTGGGSGDGGTGGCT
jgi:hypothetical protein